MRLKPWLAGLAAAVSLAAQPAQAVGCPAKSTRFEDIVVALNKAPGCGVQPAAYRKPANMSPAASTS